MRSNWLVSIESIARPRLGKPQVIQKCKCKMRSTAMLTKRRAIAIGHTNTTDCVTPAPLSSTLSSHYQIVWKTHPMKLIWVWLTLRHGIVIQARLIFLSTNMSLSITMKSRENTKVGLLLRKRFHLNGFICRAVAIKTKSRWILHMAMEWYSFGGSNLKQKSVSNLQHQACLLCKFLNTDSTWPRGCLFLAKQWMECQSWGPRQVKDLVHQWFKDLNYRRLSLMKASTGKTCLGPSRWRLNIGFHTEVEPEKNSHPIW